MLRWSRLGGRCLVASVSDAYRTHQSRFVLHLFNVVDIDASACVQRESNVDGRVMRGDLQSASPSPPIVLEPETRFQVPSTVHRQSQNDGCQHVADIGDMGWRCFVMSQNNSGRDVSRAKPTYVMVTTQRQELMHLTISGDQHILRLHGYCAESQSHFDAPVSIPTKHWTPLSRPRNTEAASFLSTTHHQTIPRLPPTSERNVTSQLHLPQSNNTDHSDTIIDNRLLVGLDTDPRLHPGRQHPSPFAVAQIIGSQRNLEKPSPTTKNPNF